MPLNDFPYISNDNRREIVSEENRRKHVGLNPDNKCRVIHYRVDEVILQNQKACDFILINETDGIAFLIELKGCRVDNAVDQLKTTEETLHEYLKNYKLQYRIVTSTSPSQKSRTTSVKTSYSKIISLWEKKGQFKMSTTQLIEKITQ